MAASVEQTQFGVKACENVWSILEAAWEATD